MSVKLAMCMVGVGLNRMTTRVFIGVSIKERGYRSGRLAVVWLTDELQYIGFPSEGLYGPNHRYTCVIEAKDGSGTRVRSPVTNRSSVDRIA